VGCAFKKDSRRERANEDGVEQHIYKNEERVSSTAEEEARQKRRTVMSD
jgi:hypothetical protein